MQTVQPGTLWFPETKTIDTHISGSVNFSGVEQWEASLHRALSQIENNGVFKIMIDLHGFKAIDLDTHKRFRTIIPLTLSQYGWKVGYTDLFEEEAGSIQYMNIRGIQCIAAAHVHHDDTKIGLYERSYSRSNEHYFTDPAEARNWLQHIS